MAKEKKPSIYTDRGTIGSSDELDEYGVWVKSDPQDMPLAGAESDELPAGGLDFDIPDMDDLPDFDVLQAEVSKSAGLNTAADDFDLPVMDLAGEEDSSSDVFNFGDFTEQIDIPESADSGGSENSTPLDSLAETDSSFLKETPDFDDDGIVSISEDGPEVDGASGGIFGESLEDSAGILSEGIFGEDAGEISGGEAEDGTVDISGDDFSDISMDDFSSPVEMMGEVDITDLSGIGIDSVPELSAFDPPRAEEQKEQNQDLSTQLLMKIAEELSSIRTELTSLKKEFSGIKVAAEGVEKANRGEEEDEKISLTGDELNNILNTADFTEEAGEDDSSIELNLDDIDSTELPLDTDSGFETLEDLDMEINLGNTSLELLEGETRLGTSAEVADIDLPDDLEIADDLIPDLQAAEGGELNEIREQGVEPMASALDPKDAEYLAEDPLAAPPGDGVFDVEEISVDSSMDISDDSIDFSTAVIDEPDLSSGIQDIPIEEPSLEDISINLDFTELESAEPDFEEAEIAELDSVESNSAELDSLDSVEQVSEEPDFEELEVLNLDEAFAMDSSEQGSAEQSFDELDSGELEPVELSSGADFQPGGDLSLIPEGYTEELPVEEAGEDGLLEEILPEETLEELASEELTLEEVANDDTEPLFDESPDELEPLGDLAEDDEIAELTDEVEELVSEESPAKSVEEDSLAAKDKDGLELPGHLKQELKTVLSYMDRLLEALPDNKIEEFARSEYYDTYKKLFKDLGLA